MDLFYIMEQLNTMRPDVLQVLLENIDNNKVKRLFLYMAEKINHQWFQFLKTDNIDLGKGHRTLSNNGVYNAKYMISIPKELDQL